MTLDTTKPNDQELVSDLPSFIREDRAAINAIVGSNSFGYTDLDIAVGTTTLVVGTDLGANGLEVIKVTGLGLADISAITGGSEGQIKVLIFQDTNINIVDGNARAGGVFYLNHLPVLSNFEPDQDDILAVVNIGGDGAATPGYWKELFRTISVK